MKIDLSSVDKEQFILKEGIFCGEEAILITPQHVGCKWRQDNKHLRSSIWDKQGQILSAGLPKFVNMGENPEHFPVPKSLENSVFVDKIDGSLVVCDYINNQLSMRTRGTFSYKTLENYADFEYCLAKYPNIGIVVSKFWPNHSLLFEITTPNLKIVLDYGQEPDFTLIGAIDKFDYSLVKQDQLDLIAQYIGVKRPETFKFDSITEMVEKVKTWEGKEGICWYHSNQQQITKLKSLIYLKLHHFKESANLDTVFELFCSYGYPTLEEFQTKLTQQFDYECYSQVESIAKDVIAAYEQVKLIKAEILEFVNPLKSLPRKEAAQSIIKQFGGRNLSSFAFMALDGKEVDIKKLLGLTLGLR